MAATARATDTASWSGLAGLGMDALGQDIERFRHAWLTIGFADASRSGTGHSAENGYLGPETRR
jgi:hypothetical protein